MVTEHLLLRAEKADDLLPLSACAQDMAIRAADVAWIARERRLVLVGNRFRWENATRGPKHGGDTSRVRSALRFDFVTGVQRRHWPANTDTVLALLAVTFDDADGGDALLLSFAGGAALRVSQEVLDVTLEDLSGPWGALAIPDHDRD